MNIQVFGTKKCNDTKKVVHKNNHIQKIRVKIVYYVDNEIVRCKYLNKACFV